jgi:predicted transcriptional regulator
MTSKRSKDQILFQILKTCHRKDSSKTNIVYSSGMNFNTIRPYLALLMEKELLETVDGSPVLYRITPKGLEALEHIRALDGLIFANSTQE